MRKKRDFILLMFLMLLVGFVMSVAREYSVLIVSGRSMLPTYQDKTILLSKKYHQTPLNRGTVVAFKKDWHIQVQGQHEEIIFIKRIIAKEEDIISVDHHYLYLNQKPIIKFKEELKGSLPSPLKIPQSSYFVVGDNHGHSYDSLKRWLNNEKEVTIKNTDIISVVGGG